MQVAVFNKVCVWQRWHCQYCSKCIFNHHPAFPCFQILIKCCKRAKVSPFNGKFCCTSARSLPKGGIGSTTQNGLFPNVGQVFTSVLGVYDVGRITPCNIDIHDANDVGQWFFFFAVKWCVFEGFLVSLVVSDFCFQVSEGLAPETRPSHRHHHKFYLQSLVLPLLWW